MTAELLPDSQCDQTGYPSDTQMMRDIQRAEHATERDRIWQAFLATPEGRRHTVADVSALCRLWFLQGVIEDVRRERRRRIR